MIHERIIPEVINDRKCEFFADDVYPVLCSHLDFDPDNLTQYMLEVIKGVAKLDCRYYMASKLPEGETLTIIISTRSKVEGTWATADRPTGGMDTLNMRREIRRHYKRIRPVFDL